GAVQDDQHGQGPGPGGEGEAHQDGQHDPLVAPTPGGITVRGADRVAVAALAPDLLALVRADGVVGHLQAQGPGAQADQNQAAEGGSQAQARPAGLGEDTAVAGGIAVGQAAQGAEQVGDGAAPGGQQRRQQQQAGALGGGLGEGRSELQQQP